MGNAPRFRPSIHSRAARRERGQTNAEIRRCSLADAHVATAAKRWFVLRDESTVWRRVHRLATRPPSGDASTVWRRWLRLRLPISFLEFPGFERTNETTPKSDVIYNSTGHALPRLRDVPPVPAYFSSFSTVSLSCSAVIDNNWLRLVCRSFTTCK